MKSVNQTHSFNFWKSAFIQIISFICIFGLITLSACTDASSEVNSNNSNTTVVSGSSAQPAKKTLTIGISSVPTNFDTLEHTDDAILDVFFQPLVQYNEDGTKFENILADSITSQDNQTFSAKLNNKAKWTDGEPVTADDVIYTVKAITSKKVAAIPTSKFSIFEGTDDAGFSTSTDGTVSGITKVDDHTVTFKTKSPLELSIVEAVFTVLRPLPSHVLKNVPIEKLFTNQLFQNPTVTDGPFKLVSYQKDQFIQMEANKDYYRGAPKIDQLNFKITSNIAAELETGEIDLNESSVSFKDLEKVKALKNVTTVVTKDESVGRMLFINTKTVPDARVRRAISYAIDRNAIVSGALSGIGKIEQGPFLSNNVFFDKAYSTVVHDPEKSKQLLKEANWNTTKELNFVADAGSATGQKVVQVIADNLKSVGLNVKVQQLDHATTLARARKGNFDLTNFGYQLIPSNPDVSFLISSKGSFNLSQYSNPQVDKWLEQGLTTVNPDDRKAIYGKIQQQFNEDLPCPFLYGEYSIHCANKRVTSGPIGIFGVYNNLHLWNVN